MSHLANLISSINVGIKCSKTDVHYAYGTKFLKSFVKAIYSANLINRYSFLEKNGKLLLSMELKLSFLKNVKMLSKPGRKLYISVYQLKSLLYKNNRKVYIISTSTMGVIHSGIAINNNIGGELLCEFYHI